MSGAPPQILEYAAPPLPDPSFANRVDYFLRQVAHRALSLGIWLLAARIVFAFWPRNFDFTFYLLPATFVCLDVALIAAFIALVIARRDGRDDAREPLAAALAAVVLLIPTLAWMFLPSLIHQIWSRISHT
jgi:hypothetical protein